MEAIKDKPVNPQAENGHIDIANEIAEAFSRLQLSGNEWRILWVILRQTYGWHKKTDRISYTQFEQRTCLKRRHIQRGLGNLIARDIVTRIGNGRAITYGLQKNFTKWLSLPKMVTNEQIVTKKCNLSLPKMVNTKENTKEKILQIHKGESASALPTKKKTDPGVKIVIDWFACRVEEVRGFKPEIGGQDAKTVKRLLAKYPEETLKNIIAFFLNSKKADEEPTYHFHQTGKLVAIGSGTQRPRMDYYLDR